MAQTTRNTPLQTLEILEACTVKQHVRQVVGDSIATCYRRRFGAEHPWHLVVKPRGSGALRLLTLPALWQAETLWFETLPVLRRKVDEIVGLEHSHNGITEARILTAAAEFKRRFDFAGAKMVFSSDRGMLIQQEDNPARDAAQLHLGFDAVWMDYCYTLTQPPLQSLSLWVRRTSDIFSRAWSHNRPGIFWVTLQQAVDVRACLAEFRYALDSFGLQRITADQRLFRPWGLSAWLNYQAAPLDITWLPAQFLTWRSTGGARMWAVGYETYPLRFSWAQVADPIHQHFENE